MRLFPLYLPTRRYNHGKGRLEYTLNDYTVMVSVAGKHVIRIRYAKEKYFFRGELTKNSRVKGSQQTAIKIYKFINLISSNERDAKVND